MRLKCLTIFFLLFAFHFAFAQEEFPEIVQVTTTPEEESFPAISPDGKWLAFTSNRSGNLDIWVKKLPRGPLIQVTTHEADDFDPVWSPDGKSLVFTSTRRDGEGDLWMVKITKQGESKGKPIQLTRHLGLDAQACFSPNGRYIAYVSNKNGVPAIWILDLRNQIHFPLTHTECIDPVWSPDGKSILCTSYLWDKGGDIAQIELMRTPEGKFSIQRMRPLTQGPSLDNQPCVSPRGDRIAFVRRDEDTDGDGKITPLDHGHIWVQWITARPESLSTLTSGPFPLTGEPFDQGEPCWAPQGQIFYASSEGHGKDIWGIPENGITGIFSSAQQQLAEVENRFLNVATAPGLFQQIVEYQKIPLLFPQDTLSCARAWLKMGEIYVALNQQEKAKACLDRVISQFPSSLFEFHRAIFYKTTLSFESPENRRKYCEYLLSLPHVEPGLRADTWIVLGDLSLGQGKVAEALKYYGNAVEMEKEVRNAKALAFLKIGDVFRSQGQEEMAQRMYFPILKQFGDVPLWRDRAGDRILGQIQGPPEMRITQYRQIIEKFIEYPSLLAKAQLAIVQSLIELGEYDVAVRELERIPERVPTEKWAHARAKILNAKVNQLRGDELRSIFLLESVIKEFAWIDGGQYSAEAKEVLFQLCFESAERLKKQGDYALAASRYRKALEVKPEEIRVHRGFIECQARLDQPEKAVSMYRDLLQAKPKDPILLYAYGLALSYLGEKEEKMLLRSNEVLLRSIEIDYRNVYAYWTLGYNYEALERFSEIKRNQKPPLFLRGAKTLFSPLVSTIQVLPLFLSHKKTSQQKYTEKAVEVLLTGLEFNDEKENPTVEIALLQNLANNFYHLGEFGYRKACLYYQQRLALDTTFSNLLEKAVFFERAGHSALYASEWDFSAQCLKTASRIFQALGHEEEVLLNQRRLALLYLESGKFQDAVTIYQHIAKKDEFGSRWKDLEIDYRNMAYAYTQLKEPEEALVCAKKAEAILSKEKMPKGPPKKRYLRIGLFGFTIPVWGMEEIGGGSAEGFTLPEERALVLGLISQNAEALYRFGEALEAERKRLWIFQKQKERFGERVALNRLGMLHFKAMQYDSAWFYTQLAYTYSQKANDLQGQWINALNLGQIALREYCVLNQKIHLEEAKQILEGAIKQFSEKPSISKEELAQAYGVLGTLEFFNFQGLRQGEKPSVSLESAIRTAFQGFRSLLKAKAHFEKGLEVARNANAYSSQVEMLAQLAQIDALLGDFASAQEKLQEAKETVLSHGEKNLLWRIQAQLASYASDSDTALTIYQKAIEELEFSPPQGKDMLEIGMRKALYAQTVEMLTRKGSPREALATAEKARQKQVADFLFGDPPPFEKERHKIAWGNIQFLEESLGEVREQIRSAVIQKTRGSLLRELKNKEAKLNAEYTLEMKRLKDEDPLLAYLAGALPIDLETWISPLLAHGNLLYYFSGGNTVAGFFVSKDTMIASLLPRPSFWIKSNLQQLLSSIEKGALDSTVVDSLFACVLEPFSNVLPSHARLIIIPDGILWSLPFELFRSKIAVASIQYLPSVAFYTLALDKRKAQLEGHTFRTLHKEASETTFKEALLHSDFVNIDTWILSNPYHPLRSALMFQPSRTDDGYFRIQDCFSLRARSECIVLPPFSEKIGVSPPIELWMYGFLYSGISTVFSLLWPVDSRVKQSFVENVLRSAQSQNWVDAFEEALQLIQKQYPNPKYWAGFRCIGFPGMEKEERKAFAQTHFVQTILQARHLQENGEYSDALGLLEKALVMGKALQDSLQIRRLYQELVSLALQGKEWDKAIFYQRELNAIATREKNWTSLERGVKNLFHFYVQQGKYPEADSISSTWISLLQERKSELAFAYEQKAYVQALLRKFDQADSSLHIALRIYQEVKDKPGEARIHLLRGRFLLEAERFWEAKQWLEQGVSALEEALESNPMDKKLLYELASGFQFLGLANERLGFLEEAIFYQEKGLELFQTLSRPIQVAQGLQYLANVYWKKGDYVKALQCQQAVLDTLKKNQNPKELAAAYGTLGLIYFSLGKGQEAQVAMENALDLSRQNSTTLADHAMYLNNLGWMKLREHRLDIAVDLFRRAIEIDSAYGFSTGLAYAYRNLGWACVLSKKQKEGLFYLRKALALSRAISDPRNEVLSQFFIAKAHALNKQWPLALAILDTAIAKLNTFSAPDLFWRLLAEKGIWLGQMGMLDSSYTVLSQTLDWIEFKTKVVPLEWFGNEIFCEPKDVYEALIHLLFEKGEGVAAFRFSERAKSWEFVQAMQAVSLPLSSESQNWFAKEKALRTRILQGEESDFLKHTYERFLDSTETPHPELVSLVRVKGYPIEKIQSLLAPGVAWIEYFTGKETLSIWVITQNSVEAKQIKISSLILDSLVFHMRKALESSLSIDQEANALYQWLIGGIQNALENVHHCIFVPDAALRALPFGLLQNQKGEMLCDRFTLSYMHRADEFIQIKKQKAIALQTVFAVGNPDLGNPQYELPFAEKEVQSLARTFGEIFSLTRDHATKRNVVEALQRKSFDVVHFACHGTMVPEDPFASSVWLSPKDGEEGRLFLRELFGFTLPCKLITFSACGYSMDKPKGIDFSTGPFFGGTRAVIAPLWKVDDLATGVLMKRFYRYWKRGDSKAKALQKAMQWVRNEVNSYASFWAGFQLWGDFQ